MIGTHGLTRDRGLCNKKTGTRREARGGRKKGEKGEPGKKGNRRKWVRGVRLGAIGKNWETEENR